MDKGYTKKGVELAEALENIIWYNGHYVWLKKLRDDMATRLSGGFRLSFSMPKDIEWHTEQHFIWMLLVGVFGEWGTSIRSGWIEDVAGCMKFIDQICEDSWEVDKEGSKDVSVTN